MKLASGDYEEKSIDISKLSKLEIVETSEEIVPDEEICLVSGDEFADAKE